MRKRDGTEPENRLEMVEPGGAGRNDTGKRCIIAHYPESPLVFLRGENRTGQAVRYKKPTPCARGDFGKSGRV